MSRIVVFGNSSSGKSTLAQGLREHLGIAHLDLDTLAWKTEVATPTRAPLGESQEKMSVFFSGESAWVVEGCYSDLLEFALLDASRLVFLDLPLEICIQNAKKRPWEPHKYKSKEAQDANLPMLLDWIADYERRDDTFSKTEHQRLYQNFDGAKARYETLVTAAEILRA